MSKFVRFARQWIAPVSFVLLLPAAYASRSTVTISGLEQVSGSHSDSGSVTLTVNGRSQTVSFGQFSTPASIASGLAAKFSQDCQGPLQAKANGAVITFWTKAASASIYEVSTALTWDQTDFASSSFDILHSTTAGGAAQVSYLDVSCAPNPVLAGDTTECGARLLQGGDRHRTVQSRQSRYLVNRPYRRQRLR